MKNYEVDGISSASCHFFYEQSSYSKEELFQALELGQVTTSLATVNPDGLPNLAVLIPKVADETHLMFGLSANQTKLNLARTKEAVLLVYAYFPQELDKFKKNQGARVKLQLEEDPKVLQNLTKKIGKPGLTFLKIKEILPLG